MPKTKNIKECLKELLNKKEVVEGKSLRGSMILAKSLFSSAKDGNVQALKALIELTEEENELKELSSLYKALDKHRNDD